ncbi:class I SAM-dependent methyltransferase [Sulfurimonas sp. SAG-AH-194-I05]|nr:class I SAM-dependent methyltransferase [Sulfurimonas sp. SAG-AH-194-I05]MDF1874694.1 class I SAM-dependent methyltransferase [Sulfurimonas sp. SAG-AH-194-I05]
MRDNFKDKANNWDKGSTRTNGAKTIANAIEKKIVLNAHMRVMDFGVGTGLLGFEIAKSVEEVIGVDTSKAMLEKLEEKNTTDLSIEPWHVDIVTNPTSEIFDGIVSSMTLHHVENLKLFFQTIYKNINKNGFLAIADLEKEDGTFHSDNTGVYHFGFDKEELCQIVEACGFKNVIFENINTIKKPQRDFGVFLLTAIK